ncbi:hypothetical protein AWJ19_22695 [Paenibacillus sp. DMB5]|nr:hypothetical protein AWJ19_22695 [Paenibacillus sp. DMB5]
MGNCMFCSKEDQMLFRHSTHDIGSLCLVCYMKLIGSCGVCSESLLPLDVKPDVTYEVKAQFIGLGNNKNFVVCSHCFEAILKEFPQMFA